MLRNPPQNPANPFAEMLFSHLKNGTRPATDAGEPWTYAEFAEEVPSSRENSTVSPSSVSNWCNGRSIPERIDPILRALFGPSDRHAVAREALRRAFQEERARRYTHNGVENDPVDSKLNSLRYRLTIENLAISSNNNLKTDEVCDHTESPILVRIPPGTFTMGLSLREINCLRVPIEYGMWSSPQQKVAITAPFWLGKFPVTRGQYGHFVTETGYQTPKRAWTFEPRNGNEWTYEFREERWWLSPGFPQTENDPIVCVSHEDAMAYIAWLNQITKKTYRLPSEAEWEYAARGNKSSLASAKRKSITSAIKGLDYPELFELKYDAARTTPVGTFRPNEFGLHDMVCNVWEWTADHWNETLRATPNDGSPNTTGYQNRRARRGGSWNYDPRLVHPADRFWGEASGRYDYTGFRVARTLSPSES